MPGAGSERQQITYNERPETGRSEHRGGKRGPHFDQLLGRKEVQFDLEQVRMDRQHHSADAALYVGSGALQAHLYVRAAATPPKCGVLHGGIPVIFCLNCLKKPSGAKFTIVPGYQGWRVVSNAAKCNAGRSTSGLFWPRAVSDLAKKGTCANDPDRQEERSKIERRADVYELMDQYKTAASLRRLADVMLSAGRFGLWPAMTSPKTPDEHVIYARALRRH